MLVVEITIGRKIYLFPPKSDGRSLLWLEAVRR